jgi:Tol biopolymer transport system component
MSPTITPDGRHVVYIGSRNGLQTPWIAPLDGSEATEIAASFAGFNTVSVSPDSRKVTFVTVSENSEAILVVCDLPTCANRRDLPLPLNSRGPTRFTPDGTEVAYLDRFAQNIWALPVDGRPARQVTNFPDEAATGRAIASFAWSPDGTRLVIARVTTKEDIVLFRGVMP